MARLFPAAPPVTRAAASMTLATGWCYSADEADVLISHAEQSRTGMASDRKPGYRTAWVTALAAMPGYYIVEEGLDS